jgi:endonuclease/exonuclease/phosphatase family metal-dependent hydrolase
MRIPARHLSTLLLPLALLSSLGEREASHAAALVDLSPGLGPARGPAEEVARCPAPGLLCSWPDGPQKLRCRIERGSFRQGEPTPPEEVVVLAYNMERGVRLPAQIAALKGRGSDPSPDLLLLSEVDRGCSRSGYRDVAGELAQALSMEYVFAVEYVELPRAGGAGGVIDKVCEHGNAILSRFPLEAPRQIRHRVVHRWPTSVPAGIGQPRLGGRVTLRADVRLGDRCLRAYAMHLDSGLLDGHYRAAQAAELIADAARSPWPVLVGGDANSHAYRLDLAIGTSVEPVTRLLASRGFRDAHAGRALSRRATLGPLLVDLVLGRGVVFGRSGINDPAAFAGLSDHLPVWATVSLDGDRSRQGTGGTT